MDLSSWDFNLGFGIIIPGLWFWIIVLVGALLAIGFIKSLFEDPPSVKQSKRKEPLRTTSTAPDAPPPVLSKSKSQPDPPRKEPELLKYIRESIEDSGNEKKNEPEIPVKQNLCSNCNQPIVEGDKFCGECGQPV